MTTKYYVRRQRNQELSFSNHTVQEANEHVRRCFCRWSVRKCKSEPPWDAAALERARSTSDRLTVLGASVRGGDTRRTRVREAVRKTTTTVEPLDRMKSSYCHGDTGAEKQVGASNEGYWGAVVIGNDKVSYRNVGWMARAGRGEKFKTWEATLLSWFLCVWTFT